MHFSAKNGLERMSSNPRGPTSDYDSYESAVAARSYVDEILEQDARLRAGPPVSRRRRIGGTVAFVMALPTFLALTAMNFMAARRPVEALTPQAAAHEAQVGIYLAIQQIEAYRSTTGQLPSGLAEVGADGPGLVFTRGPQGYELVAQVEGATERYRSGEDPLRFETAATSLFVDRDGPR